jgi:hypothetical protein
LTATSGRSSTWTCLRSRSSSRPAARIRPWSSGPAEPARSRRRGSRPARDRGA